MFSWYFSLVLIFCFRKKGLPLPLNDIVFIECCFSRYHFLSSLSISLKASFSSFEKANHFFPRSFNDAPKWKTSLSSIIMNLSCAYLNLFISTGVYWELYFFRSRTSCFEIVFVKILTVTPFSLFVSSSRTESSI